MVKNTAMTIDQTIVNKPRSTLLVLFGEIGFREVNVEGDEEGALTMVVVVAGHALVCFANPRSRPRDFLAHNVYLSYE